MLAMACGLNSMAFSNPILDHANSNKLKLAKLIRLNLLKTSLIHFIFRTQSLNRKYCYNSDSAENW